MKRAMLIPIAAAIALFLLYLNFVYTFVQSNILQGATSLEAGLFTLQFAKVITIVSLRRLRDMKFVNVINVLGAELVVALPGLGIATEVLGDHGISSLMSQIFLAWIAGAAAAVIPYCIYRLARSMMRGDRLVFVLPAGILLSELLLLLNVGTSSSVASGQGLAGISRTIILLGGGEAGIAAQSQGLIFLLTLSIFYASLLLHALSPSGTAGETGFVVVAAFGVLSMAVAFAGAYAASLLAMPFTYVVLPPALAVPILIWWGTREA